MAILTRTEVWRRPKPTGPVKYTPDLTDNEQANVKKALRMLRLRFDGWQAVAERLRVPLKTVTIVASKNRKISVALALRISRLAGAPLEDVLSGAWPKAGSCPMCGRCG